MKTKRREKTVALVRLMHSGGLCCSSETFCLLSLFHASFVERDAGAPAINATTVGNASSADPSDTCSQPQKDTYTHARKLPWALYGRCTFSLCGSLIHNTGAWNLVDLFIM